MVKKDLIIAVICTFCLTATLFMIIPTRSQTTTAAYDPWVDLNDDGVIDIFDLTKIALSLGASGTPINKTELLYNINATLIELLSRMNSLNATTQEHESLLNQHSTQLAALEAEISQLNDLIATLNTKVDNLNASLAALEADLQSRIAELEADLAILNATKLGRYNWDSTWFSLTPGAHKNFTHNLGTTNLLVYMYGYSTYEGHFIHQRSFGGDTTTTKLYGAWWYDLTASEIRVKRGPDDVIWTSIRILIWKIP